eukprot:CAMPEP_0168605540 /NCGR_PEP_ID=MMETSP0420-20121227/16038_1 /TAXON_ID=498008 /ORGANISM="Pessonella sp." /LENGTH=82 /DNA_ID=CAMNT_0008645037 /DNA_START=291 /DNA_END=536 /DNA_ORIENTATION=+
MSDESRSQLKSDPIPEEVLFSPVFLLDWAFSHVCPAVIVCIEVLSNYHIYHGPAHWGVLAVVVYGLATVAWHVAAFYSTQKW